MRPHTLGIQGFFKRIVRPWFEPEFKELSEEIKALSDRNRELDVLCAKQQKHIQDYSEMLVALKKTDAKAEYWNNRWPKNKVLYKIDGQHSCDVRNLIFTKSHVLQSVANSIKGQSINQDDIMKKVLKWTIMNIKYKTDQQLYGQPELWQNPEVTYSRKQGDCEDGALLMITLARLCGIPAYKIKLCAGFVKTGTKGKEGHAYCIYLADDEKWYTLDWCYWKNESLNNFKKKPHSQNPNYIDIWWTANDEFSWSQHETILN